jgi:hypothetical protein
MSKNPYEPPQTELAKFKSHGLAAEQAEAILRNLLEYQRPEQEYHIVDGDDNRHVCQRFYRNREAEFKMLGFTFLGDMEIESLKNTPLNPRTFLRIMVDRQRTTAAAFYHITPRFLFRIFMFLFRFPSKVIELESYTDLGGTICTTNMPAKVEVPHPKVITKNHVSRRLSVADMYDRHLNSLSKLPEGNVLHRIQGIQDVIFFQNVQHRITHDHLRQIGWVTKEFLRNQGISERMVDEVYDEIQRLGREMQLGVEKSTQS